MRGRIGIALLRHLAKIALDRGNVIEWRVLNRTPSIRFYERLGAQG